MDTLKQKFDYKNEIKIYLYLVDKNIVLLCSPSGSSNNSSNNSSMCYHITNEISLCNYLKKIKNNYLYNSNYNSNIKLLLNELFCFVNKFKSYNFIHGNLNVYNIYLNPDAFLNSKKCLRQQNFYVINFDNSKIYKKYNKYNIYNFNWDLFTLYISLKIFFKKDTQNLVYLETLILNYINKSHLKYLLHKYISII